MTPLRKLMIRELELHRKAPGTVSSYVKAVEELALYYGRSPDRISREEVRDKPTKAHRHRHASASRLQFHGKVQHCKNSQLCMAAPSILGATARALKAS